MRPRVLDISATGVPDAGLDLLLESAYGIFSGEPECEALLGFAPERSRWVAKEERHSQQRGRYLLDGSSDVFIPYGTPDELIWTS